MKKCFSALHTGLVLILLVCITGCTADVEESAKNSQFDNQLPTPGFHDDVKANLFQTFFTTKETGMGVGLSISRSIIEAHGGRMWAESNPAGGATFRFTLPAAENES